MLLVDGSDLGRGAKGKVMEVRPPPSSRALTELIRNFRKLSISLGSGVVVHAAPLLLNLPVD